MDLTAAAVNLTAADSMVKLQYALAAKMLQTTEVQGQAAVKLIEAAGQMIEQASADMVAAIEGLGASLDLLV